ncbi:MAG: hypothetical protein ACLR5H_04080 [Oscillospiraceae bacterium]
MFCRDARRWSPRPSSTFTRPGAGWWERPHAGLEGRLPQCESWERWSRPPAQTQVTNSDRMTKYVDW